MKLSKIIGFFLSYCFVLPGLAAENPNAQPNFFAYQEFLAVRNLDPQMQDAQLCGMNQICVKMWKGGEMMLPEHGLVIRSDFNEDGQPDIAIAMEKTVGDAPTKDIYMMIATKDKDGNYKLLQTVKFPQAHSFVECYTGEPHNKIVVDLGERDIIYGTTMQLYDGTIINSTRKAGGTPVRLLTYLTWNKKTQKFDVTTDKLPES